jgi:Protein of unknown function (DUF3306)
VSDQESFLTRWSRRKREADPAASDEAPAAAAPNATARAENDETEAPPANSPPAVEQQEPAVDLANLPPIESITAGTDIRAFLAPGIPAHLTRAALRRAWVADPAIRDFVGLAENAWDFNAPDAIPGFGSVVSQEAQRLIAELVRNDDRVSSPEGPCEPPQKPDVNASDATPSSPAAVKEVPVADATDLSPGKQNDADAALQKEDATDDRPTRSARHHGGALPH